MSFTSTTMLARQPIIKANQETYAYELLYRGDKSLVDGDEMSAVVLSNTFNHFGIDAVTDGALIFVNLPRELLLSDFPSLLPTERTVLEILEDVPADENVIASIQNWKNQGFTIALDDFISMSSHQTKLLPYADIVKVDILECEDDLKTLVHELRRYPVKLLAEKVETHEEFELCKKLGFDYFQGYFFCKPSLIVDNHSLASHKEQLLLLLTRTMEAESPNELEFDISHDLAFSYKLLCYINSAFLGIRSKIDSISHALAMLGLDKLRIWASMLLMASLAHEKPEALLSLAFSRGRFLELLAKACNNNAQINDYFILGMFSVLDALLDQTMEKAIGSRALPDLVRNGLLSSSGEAPSRLALMHNLERGNWNKHASQLETIGINSDKIPSLYTESVQWADQRVALIKTL
jgi:EAL and modified HD-GYP domain-containing signal transduction protein